ncbi:MAG: hypothetical protein HYX68_14390 [Planctomycetes bacterium]|nr:hypothetical protein [Planctomycetota bacterium]
MSYWAITGWCALGLAALPALYGVHRFCLWLEARGHLYYWHRRPESSAAGCMVALQKAVEPQVQHVQEAKEGKRHHNGEGAPGGPPEP